MAQKNVSPEDIFTPSAIVSREMFAKRNEPDQAGNPGLQDLLRDALRERGGQILMYGDTGVGKSSLLRYAAEDEDLKVLSVECMSSKAYGDLIEDAIRKLITVRETQRTTSKSGEAGIEGSAGANWLLTIKGRVVGRYGKERTFEVVQKPPLDALLIAMDRSSTNLLVLDNFQNIQDEPTRHHVAQTMEFLSDRSGETNNTKVVVIGIAEDASSLIGGSGSFRRRTTEIGVPRMPDDEIQEILTRGFRFLNLTIDDEALRDMIFFSDGFPFFAHLLGLYAARSARFSHSSNISKHIVDTSLVRAAHAVDRSYADRTRLAIEAGGDVRPRERILSILASSGQREWRSADVISAYGNRFEERSDYSFLHTALAQLIDDKYGAILRRTGTRNKYVYRFADPHMRPYLRITKILAHS